MLFNSKIFILVFLPIVLAGYYLCNRMKKEKAGMIWLIAMSLFFYGYFKPGYLPIIVGSVIVNYIISAGLHKLAVKKPRKLLLLAGLCFNIGLLFVFKYYNFFIKNMNQLAGADLPLLNVVMPLGISFFTFQQISYLVDSYRREMPFYSWVEYAAYVLFFPQLVAGPIVLHNELIPQFLDKEKKIFSQEWFAKGIYAFSLGLGKKVLVADTLGLIVEAGYSQIALLNSTDAIVVVLAYTLQIYFDFSGYCDMARGIGYMFHIDLPNNFNSPYKALSISEFWKRWHMTLTRFLTKYIYIPLGGNRKGNARTYINIMIVFALSGLWHGAEWSYIVWGVLHGAAMLLDRLWGRYLEKVPRIIRWCMTFCFISLSWVYFRADTIGQANQLLGRVFMLDFGGVSEEIYSIVISLEEMLFLQFIVSTGLNYLAVAVLAFMLIAGIAGCVFMKNTQEKVAVLKPTLWKSMVTMFLLCYGIVSLTGASIFLYFNF